MLKNKKILFAGKIMLSVGLIYWLLSGADLQTIWQIVKTAKAGYLAFAFALFYVGYVLISYRWQMLLRVENIKATLPYLLESVNIGILFNNLLPTTIGGDAYRMYDVWRLGARKTTAVLVILIDRFLGMFAMVTYGLIAALLATEVGEAVPGIAIYLAGIIFGMLLIMWMVFGSGAKILQWFMDLETRLLSIPQKIVGKIRDGLALYRGRGDVLIKALLVSYLLQFNVIVHFIVVAYALGIDIPWTGMFVIIPIANLIMLLPISINGVGVREAILVFLFGIYGISTESAIAFAWVWLAMTLAQGLVGGLVFVLRRNREDTVAVKSLME